MPFPAAPAASPDPAMMATVRIVMVAFWLTLAGIGIWWLVFFTRTKVVEQFVPPSVPSPGASSLSENTWPNDLPPSQASAGKRPLSITIIAWLLLVGCVFMSLALVFRMPAVVFTSLVVGRTASLIHLCFAAAQLCIGIGLLRLKPAARVGAIAYFVLGFANSAVFYFAPGSHARLAALQESERSILPWMRPFQDQVQFQPSLNAPLLLGSIVGLVVVVLQLYFLITRKRAFEISSSGQQPTAPG